MVFSLSKSVTYQLLKPRLDAVLFEIIFPLMCFNDIDDKLWREDPHEYVRKGYGESSYHLWSKNVKLFWLFALSDEFSTDLYQIS